MMGSGDSGEKVRPAKMPVTNFWYWTRIGSSKPRRWRLDSTISGEQALPQVRRAGSPGSRLNRKKTVTLSKKSRMTMPMSRRIKYPTTPPALHSSQRG